MPQDQQQPFQRPETWDQRANGYERTTERLTSVFVQQVIDTANIDAGTRVLDIAAGAGALSLVAAGRGASVQAIDFSPAMLDLLRARASEQGIVVNAQVMDGQALEFPDGSFDAVCSNFGTVFFPDMTAGLREARRVLISRGTVVITGWSDGADDWRSVLDEAWRLALPDVPVEMGTSRSQNADVMLECLQLAGFTNTSVSEVHATFNAPSHEWVLDNYTTIQMSMARLPADQRRKVNSALAGILTDRFGGSTPSFMLKANMAVGVK